MNEFDKGQPNRRTEPPPTRLSKNVSRRRFLALGGGVVAAVVGVNLFEGRVQSVDAASRVPSVDNGLSSLKTGLILPQTIPSTGVHIELVATDGWISLPGTLNPVAGVAVNPYPDPYADATTGKTTYIFGFRQVPTGATPLSLKGHAQASAPLLYVDEGSDVYLHLSNAGLQQRPDLIDSHTVHWHGFRNAIPLFDGVPEMSVSVPIGADFTYYYKPTDAGTYMYHCHFEDVEHIHMGMTGVVFVRPKQNAGVTVGTTVIPAGKYAYNDGLPPSDPNSTAYNREWVIFLSEVWATAHYNDAHIQPTDWSEYHADFWLMNGRVYPDTTLPNVDPVAGGPAGSDAERLQYQPMSSLITCKEGEKVLLRIVSLGYTQSAMTVPGINLRVVGKDATYLQSRTLDLSPNADGITYINSGTYTTFDTNTVYIGPGEATDAIFTAPAYLGLDPVKGYDTYLLYNRNYAELANGSAGGYGGQMTEIHVYPTTATLPAQTAPNT